MPENSQHLEELELARWFLLSVRRHLLKAQWEDADCGYAEESGFSLDQQQQLAESFLQDRSARQSLRLVLGAPELQKRLINFGQVRDMQQLQLTETSKAYLHAEQLLLQAAQPAHGNTQTEQASLSNNRPTIASRRAARRAAQVQVQLAGEAKPSETSERGNVGGTLNNEMSDAEFRYLQKALTQNDSKAVGRHNKFRINPDHLSVLCGVLAGLLLFVIVNWLIL